MVARIQLRQNQGHRMNPMQRPWSSRSADARFLLAGFILILVMIYWHIFKFTESPNKIKNIRARWRGFITQSWTIHRQWCHSSACGRPFAYDRGFRDLPGSEVRQPLPLSLSRKTMTHRAGNEPDPIWLRCTTPLHKCCTKITLTLSIYILHQIFPGKC